MENDRAEEPLPVMEPPVQGRDPHASPGGHLLQRRTRAAFDEDLPGRGENLLVVAAGVGAQRSRVATTCHGPQANTELEKLPPLLLPSGRARSMLKRRK